MSTTDFTQISSEVLYWVKIADLDTLVGFCDELRIAIPGSKQGNRSSISNLIVRHLHSETIEELDDGGYSIFAKLHSDLKQSDSLQISPYHYQTRCERSTKMS